MTGGGRVRVRRGGRGGRHAGAPARRAGPGPAAPVRDRVAAPRTAARLAGMLVRCLSRHAARGLALVALAAVPALAQDSTSRVAKLQAEAKALAPLVRTPLARDFLAAVPKLPRVAPRTIYRD